MNCLSVFEHFVGLEVKGISTLEKNIKWILWKLYLKFLALRFSGYHYYKALFNKLELWFCAGLNPAGGVLGICDGENF